MLIRLIVICLVLGLQISSFAQETENVYPGADEKTPSRSQYFSWINNTNEGSTETHTLINLEFFNVSFTCDAPRRCVARFMRRIFKIKSAASLFSFT